MSENRLRGVLVVGLACIGVLSARQAHAGGSYVFTTFTIPGSTIAGGSAVNDDGTVVGTATTAKGNAGFIWSKGKSLILRNGVDALQAINNQGLAAGTLLGATAPGTAQVSTAILYNTLSHKLTRIDLGAKLRVAYPTGVGVNRAAIGNACDIRLNNCVAFLHTPAGTLPLSPPGASQVDALFINDAGSVAGTYDTPAVSGYAFIYHRDGQYETVNTPGPIEAFSNSGSLAGRYLGADNVWHGYVLHAGRLVSYSYPGAIYTEVQGFGPAQSVLGRYQTSAGAYESFVHAGGKYHSFQAPGAIFTNINAVSPAGTVVGYYEDAQKQPHNFLAVCPAGQAPCG